MLKIPLLLISLFFINIAQANTLQQLESELDAEQYARAAVTGLTLLREHPDNLKLKFMTALAFQKNNQPKQAIRYYKEIIAQYPELPEPRNNLAIIYLKQGNYDSAVELLVDSINTHPAYAAAYKNLNTIYQGLASEAYRKALSDEADSSSVLNKIHLTELSELYQPVMPASTPPELEVASVKPEIAPQQPAAQPPEQPVLVTNTAAVQTLTPAPVNDNQQLIELVKNWADAWSEQQFEQYTAAYTDSYRGRYSSHEEWRRQRYKRIVRRDRIKVSLSNIEVKSVTGNQAIIDFHQAYQSPGYSDQVVKRLSLKRINQQWKINREVTLAVL